MIKFKSQKDAKLFSALHPILIMIFSDMYNYAYEQHGVLLTVTQTVSNKLIDQRLKRKSPSHSEHRAIDIRTKDLDIFVLDSILKYINSKEEYKQYHYLSLSGESRLAFFHFGDVENSNTQHVHLAIHSRYAIKK